MSDEFKIIKGVINCSKINKARLFTKEGKDGKYLRVVLIRKKEKDRYGQTCFMIKEDITKEERDAGVEGNFIGDASAVKPKGNPARPTATPEADHDDDIPF